MKYLEEMSLDAVSDIRKRWLFIATRIFKKKSH
jgi:hypothetical protein